VRRGPMHEQVVGQPLMRIAAEQSGSDDDPEREKERL